MAAERGEQIEARAFSSVLISLKTGGAVWQGSATVRRPCPFEEGTTRVALLEGDGGGRPGGARGGGVLPATFTWRLIIIFFFLLLMMSARICHSKRLQTDDDDEEERERAKQNGAPAA